MRDFPWFHERNGQLTKLQEEGMITKPRFYDNGADITLTQAGRNFSVESEGSVSLTKEKIYEILLTLHKEMKMPDDCFGYERRQTNSVIKYFQDEGLISGAGIAMGGVRKLPTIIWLESATITLKGLQFIEDFEHASNEPTNINLSYEFITVCAKIADN